MDTKEDAMYQVDVQDLSDPNFKLIQLLTSKTNLVASLKNDNALLEAEQYAARARHKSHATTSAKEISEATSRIQLLEKKLEIMVSELDKLATEHDSLHTDLKKMAVSLSQEKRQVSTLSLERASADTRVEAAGKRAEEAEEAEKRALKTEQELQQLTSKLMANGEGKVPDSEEERMVKVPEKRQ